MPSPGPDCFSQTYAEAREKFLAATESAGLFVQSHLHPLLGRDGERLALDVVRDGPPDADKLLIVSSACHGVEGYFGSAVQTALLADTAWRESAHDSGVAVLVLHALNPHGFSWWRRTTHENVDLNRNFHDFSQPLPGNPGYDELASLLVPPTWPPSDAVNAAIGRFIAERGLRELQAAVSSGQHDHPQGLFYGGSNPTWSHVALRHVLHEHATRCTRLGWVDLHTGLGEWGAAEPIFAGREDGPAGTAALQRARAWWGDRVTSVHDGSASSPPLTGLMLHVPHDDCVQAEYTGITLEVGTVPIMAMIQALRAEQWLENHPDAPADQAQQIKRQFRDAFYIDTEEWKRQALMHGVQAVRQGLAGLASRL